MGSGGTPRHSLPDEDASSQMPAPPAGALGIEAASFASGEGNGIREREFRTDPRARSNQRAKIQRKARRRQTNAMKRLMAKD